MNDSFAVKMIRIINDSVTPVGVETAMRLQHGTLGHLSLADFAREIAILKQCKSEAPGFLHGCCHSTTRFDAYEGRRRIVLLRDFDQGVVPPRCAVMDAWGVYVTGAA